MGAFDASPIEGLADGIGAGGTGGAGGAIAGTGTD